MNKKARAGDTPPTAPIDLAPGTALGSLSSVALSSAQAKGIIARDRNNHRNEEETYQRNIHRTNKIPPRVQQFLGQTLSTFNQDLTQLTVDTVG